MAGQAQGESRHSAERRRPGACEAGFGRHVLERQIENAACGGEHKRAERRLVVAKKARAHEGGERAEQRDRGEYGEQTQALVSVFAELAEGVEPFGEILQCDEKDQQERALRPGTRTSATAAMSTPPPNAMTPWRCSFLTQSG